MSTPIFQTSYLGTKTKVFPTHVAYKVLIGPEKTIPIGQISSIELGIPLHAKIVIETSGGQKHHIPVNLKDKEALRDAIYGAMK